MFVMQQYSDFFKKDTYLEPGFGLFQNRILFFGFRMHQAKQGGLELRLPQIISLHCSCVQLPIVRTSVNAIAKAGEQFNIQNIMFKMFDT